MTSYNVAMCLYSGTTAYLSVQTLNAHTGVLSGSAPILFPFFFFK